MDGDHCPRDRRDSDGTAATGDQDRYSVQGGGNRTAISRPHGLGRYGLFEEPERGLHPAAIRELIGLMREQATPRNPIWLTTHSESVVRALGLEELILVDKVDGRTSMKSADSGRLTQADLAPLGLDEVWLSNLLGGGLPW